METAPLKSFATWARTALIREVAARIAIALAPASPQRVEQPSAVATLEKAVSAAGGWNAGRAAVADKVAYTWFNRIIALRFMDANGYTGIGVVSPERGRQGGQPEVLAEAKRGNIDSTVITNKRTVETVTALLNGTRRSDDPQGEAYALLLAEYCRHWNRSMPFMFEREGDYTELLIPANLLADDSVLARAAAVLTEKVCQDVEVIGWLYQFYISERKDDVFAGFKKGKRAGAAEIPAATQLFTPHWIVRYLVENSLGRLWLLNRPTSRLVDQMEYYITPVDDETDYLKITSPQELKIIDPACGSGHILTYAFDLLYAIYAEEGYAPSDIPGQILTNNLYGTEIDARAGALAAFALTMKARARQRSFFNKHIEPNICVLEPISFEPGELDILVTRDGYRHDEEAFWNQFKHADILGSLIQPREELIEPLMRDLAANSPDDGDIIGNELRERARRVIFQAEYLSSRYRLVIANPPYMGSGNMDAKLSELIKNDFPHSKSDLFSAFIERNLSLSVPNGQVAMITMQSWLFLSSFTKLRKRILEEHELLAMVHLGVNAFSTLNSKVVSTTAFIIQVGRGSERVVGNYLRLVEGADELAKSAMLRDAASGADSRNLYRIRSGDLAELPGAVIAYWLSKPMREAFRNGASIEQFASPRQGIKTGDNARFLRYWYEVSQHAVGRGMRSREDALASGRKWFPCQKGGQFRRWYGNDEHVVNWEKDGNEIRNFRDERGNLLSRPQNLDWMFCGGVTWGTVSTSVSSFRSCPPGSISESKGAICYVSDEIRSRLILGFLNSTVVSSLLAATSPTIDYGEGAIGRLPVHQGLFSSNIDYLVERCVEISGHDWHASETAPGFQENELIELHRVNPRALADKVLEHQRAALIAVDTLRELEIDLNKAVADVYGLSDEVSSEVPVSRISLIRNNAFRYGANKTQEEYARLATADLMRDLISYAVGCMFGRYSLDEMGLILTNQGDTLQNYLARVPDPSFLPDRDNVIPVIDGDWFEDDIVARFRQFLRFAFGEQRSEENLRFATEALGVKDLRDYFVKSFYKDHVQRYKKRPIYWLFSSPKGSFNALIYMHRYTPSTVSTVLNEYLREFKAKLEASRQHHERLAAGAGTPRQQASAQKEVDRLRNVLLELDEYEHDVLYPLATRQVQIDLDDGVKANYPKFGAALKKIIGLETSDE